ncbi:uncharacterized protein LOC134239143 [Saccostrea cucullata]|uniref:uncharacterized protein LOC134239143 n=1 Tax=Saccostrea cuccullata TaxID=36930 RepID=UPI002ED4841C
MYPSLSLIFILLVSIFLYVQGDRSCIRQGGVCQVNSKPCDNSYIRGLCNGAASRQCCISNAVKDRPCKNKGGKCQENRLSCSGSYQRNLCGGGATRQCCIPSSGTGGSCSSAKAIACKIKNSSKISLLRTNPSGVNDGADPHSNIRDACKGKPAKRSSYSCKEGKSPGGTVCLDSRILQYIYNLGTSTKYQFQVNAIAGACHSTTSKHYQGKAVDFQLHGSGSSRSAQEKSFRDACTRAGGWSHGGTHVHCQIV